MLEYPDKLVVAARLDDALRGSIRTCLREHGHEVVGSRSVTERAPMQPGEIRIGSVVHPTTRELVTTISLAVGASGQPQNFTPPAVTLGLARWLSGSRSTLAIAMTTGTLAVFAGGLALAAWHGNAPRRAGLLTSTALDDRAFDEWELCGCLNHFATSMIGDAIEGTDSEVGEVWRIAPLGGGHVGAVEEHLRPGSGSTVLVRPATRAASRAFSRELDFPGFHWSTEASALWPGVRWSGSGPALSPEQDAALARFAASGGEGRVVTIRHGEKLPSSKWLVDGRSDGGSLLDLEGVVTAFATVLDGPGKYTDHHRSLANPDNPQVASDGIACASGSLGTATEVPPAIEARFAALEAMFARRSVASEPAWIEHLLAELVPFTNDGYEPDPHLIGRSIAWCMQEQGCFVAEGTVTALEAACLDALRGGDELLEDHPRLAERLRETLRSSDAARP